MVALPIAAWAALVIALWGVFAGIAESARRGNTAARVALLLQAMLAICLTGYCALLSLALFSVKCDERCDDANVPMVRSGSWQTTHGAWQWWAQLGLAASAFVAAGIALASVMSRRYRRATTAAAVAALSIGTGIPLVLRS